MFHSDDEEGAPGEDEAKGEQEWRLKRHEREKFLEEQRVKSEIENFFYYKSDFRQSRDKTIKDFSPICTYGNFEISNWGVKTSKCYSSYSYEAFHLNFLAIKLDIGILKLQM